jgi:hypothetical protein
VVDARPYVDVFAVKYINVLLASVQTANCGVLDLMTKNISPLLNEVVGTVVVIGVENLRYLALAIVSPASNTPLALRGAAKPL